MANEETGHEDELKGDRLLEAVEQDSMKDDLPHFRVGDTVRVDVLIREGGKERTQGFEGICIARKGSGVRETFTVRRIVQGEGVERIFPLHSPHVQDIKVLERGKANRARLYYLRERSGRAARVERDMEAEAEARAQEE